MVLFFLFTNASGFLSFTYSSTNLRMFHLQESDRQTVSTPAELPKFRLDAGSPPFSNIRIDFTGHFLVKDQRGNHSKVYICLFTCLTTCALSLEFVETLQHRNFFKISVVIAVSFLLLISTPCLKKMSQSLALLVC